VWECSPCQFTKCTAFFAQPPFRFSAGDVDPRYEREPGTEQQGPHCRCELTSLAPRLEHYEGSLSHAKPAVKGWFSANRWRPTEIDKQTDHKAKHEYENEE